MEMQSNPLVMVDFTIKKVILHADGRGCLQAPVIKAADKRDDSVSYNNVKPKLLRQSLEEEESYYTSFCILTFSSKRIITY